VKTFAVLGFPTASRKPVRKNRSGALGEAQRECIALSDPTDCLLEAYDCISRRAYEHFLAQGPRLGGELEDWLNAEREVLLDLAITLEDADEFVYALTSIPGATGARLEVGIESRWLVILAQTSRPEPVRRTELASDAKGIPGLGSAVRCGHAPSLNRSGVGVRRRIAAGVEGIRLRSKSACVLELPADVDPERSIAVLSNGLLAIRMPKLNTRHRGKTEVVKA
jgi:hypothetical protein